MSFKRSRGTWWDTGNGFHSQKQNQDTEGPGNHILKSIGTLNPRPFFLPQIISFLEGNTAAFAAIFLMVKKCAA